MIGFNSYFHNMTLDVAWVRYPDGTSKAVAADAVQVKTPPDTAGYNDSVVLTFSFPTLVPKAVIEFQTTTTKKRPVIPGHWYEGFFLHNIHVHAGGTRVRIDPVYEARLSLTLPDRQRLVFGVENHKTQPRKTTRDGELTYDWVVSDIPGIPVEDNSGPISDSLPRVTMSSMTDWRTMDRWGAQVFLESAQPTPVSPASCGGKARYRK